LIKALSPNFDERPAGHSINSLIMHYTGMKTAADAFNRMCDPAAKVSAHYMVYEDGKIANLVPEIKRAWHAGISCWRGISSLNDTSIGIEIVNPGHEFGYKPFPEEQMESVEILAMDIMKRYAIEPRNVVGHSDIAPSRKQDPGELFNWRHLSAMDVGLWPKPSRTWRPAHVLVRPGEESTAVASVQARLAKYGYHIRVDAYYGIKTEQIVTAFKRHFVPEQLNASWDKLADNRINSLLSQI